jgi:hypothetical protein
MTKAGPQKGPSTLATTSHERECERYRVANLDCILLWIWRESPSHAAQAQAKEWVETMETTPAAAQPPVPRTVFGREELTVVFPEFVIAYRLQADCTVGIVDVRSKIPTR